jgi:ADP-heptose:LPS heptosyltransferase
MPRFNSDKTQKLKKFDNFLKKFLLFRRTKIYPAIIKDKVSEIIILSMYLIGDTIMFIPVLTVLKRNFPNAKITIVCGKPEEIILKNQGLADKFITVKCPWISFDYSLKNIINFFSKLKVINRIKYDLAIDFRGDWRNIFFMNFISSSRKISYNFTGGEYMLTDVIFPDPTITHYIEESFYLLKQIGCKFSEKDKLPVLKLNAEDEMFLSNFKSRNGLDDKFIIGIHAGASMEVKKWDEKKYSELIIRLSYTSPETVFVLYEGPNERNTVSAIENILVKNKIDFITINKPLHDYLILLSLCQLVVCNDSGAAHIASAFSIPTVVIYGNVDPVLVSPYGSKMLKVVSHTLDCKPCHQRFCKFGTNLCISMVTVDDVFDDAAAIINHIVKVDEIT